MVIDFHTHTFPEKIARVAVKKLEDFSKWKAVGDGTQKDLLKQMDEDGVDISVVAPVATSQKQVIGINRSLINNNRLITLGAMHPEFLEYEQEILFLKNSGVQGIKLHPDYQSFRVDDKKLFGLYEQLQANDMFILFHAGLDIGLPPPYGACPQMLKVVHDNFPKLKIVAAHLGGYDMWDEVLEYLAGLNNIWFDTAACIRDIKDETFYKILNKHGFERILMATDWPWTRAKKTIQWLERKKLKSNELEAILGDNARVLLKI